LRVLFVSVKKAYSFGGFSIFIRYQSKQYNMDFPGGIHTGNFHVYSRKAVFNLFEVQGSKFSVIENMITFAEKSNGICKQVTIWTNYGNSNNSILRNME
jgi:hypothetical protein